MQSRRGLTATSRTQLLALSFEVLTPLLGHVLGSASRDELCVLCIHRVLEVGHLGRQSLDLGPSLRLSAGRFLLPPLGSLQLPVLALHFGLHRF